MGERFEVVVLGAGISGAALAYHLAERGVGPVAVIDPRTPAAGATGRAAGIVTEQMWDRWDFDVVREARDEYARLAGRYAEGTYRTNGFARWATTPGAAAALRTTTERLRSWGAAVQPVPVETIRTLLPWVRTDGIQEACHDPSDGVVAPSALTDVYLERARAMGVEVILGAGAGPPERADGRWSVPLTGRPLRAAQLVVAAGAWSKRLLAAVRAPLPLAPYLTQAALLRPDRSTAADFPSAHDIDLDVYARPEENGRILVGDGTRLVEVDPDAAPGAGDAEFLAHVAGSFADRFPGWADAEMVRAWAGVCVSTPDRRPLIGRVPGAEGLHCLCGFNGFGVMRAGGAARRLAAALASGYGAPERDRLAPVDPGRFGERPPPFAPRPGFTVEDGPNPRW